MTFFLNITMVNISCKLLIFCFLLLSYIPAFNQEQGSMRFTKSINVPFNISSLNKLENGVELTNYTEIEVSSLDEFGGPVFSGFAIYVQAREATIEGSFTSGTIPLSKIKFQCSGNMPSGMYVDSAMSNGKLSNIESAICYWPTTDGATVSGKVRITYYCEPLIGTDGDVYLTDIDIRLKSCVAVPDLNP